MYVCILYYLLIDGKHKNLIAFSSRLIYAFVNNHYHQVYSSAAACCESQTLYIHIHVY